MQQRRSVSAIRVSEFVIKIPSLLPASPTWTRTTDTRTTENVSGTDTDFTDDAFSGATGSGETIAGVLGLLVAVAGELPDSVKSRILRHVDAAARDHEMNPDFFLCVETDCSRPTVSVERARKSATKPVLFAGGLGVGRWSQQCGHCERVKPRKENVFLSERRSRHPGGSEKNPSGERREQIVPNRRTISNDYSAASSRTE
ncbi:MAG: hypothetical protein ACI8P0_005930 [Planctomycetaceae bacterium]|jgi:hypothetical protein